MDIKENIEECWDWTSYIRPSGYGGYCTSITDNYQAHRMAYMLSKGSIPVQHLCNNPICCNPNHLELGDHSKNMQYTEDTTAICEQHSCWKSLESYMRNGYYLKDRNK